MIKMRVLTHVHMVDMKEKVMDDCVDSEPLVIFWPPLICVTAAGADQ